VLLVELSAASVGPSLHLWLSDDCHISGHLGVRSLWDPVEPGSELGITVTESGPWSVRQSAQMPSKVARLRRHRGPLGVGDEDVAI
jgi:hypothetical protein